MSKKSQFGMTLLLSTILVGGANASTVSTSNTLLCNYDCTARCCL